MSNKWTDEQMDKLIAQSQAADPQDWRDNPANQDADDDSEPEEYDPRDDPLYRFVRRGSFQDRLED